MRPLPKRGFTSRFQDSRIPDLTSRVGQSGPSPTSPHHAGCHHHRRARTGRSAASAHRNTAPIPPAPHPPHDGRDPCRDAAWLLMVTVSRWADVGWARADHHQRVRTTPDATTTAEPEPAVPQRRPTGTRPPSHRRRIPPRPPRFVPRCGLVADGDRLPVGRRCCGTVHASCRTVTVSTVPTADKIVRFGPPYVGYVGPDLLDGSNGRGTWQKFRSKAAVAAFRRAALQARGCISQSCDHRSLCVWRNRRFRFSVFRLSFAGTQCAEFWTPERNNPDFRQNRWNPRFRVLSPRGDVCSTGVTLSPAVVTPVVCRAKARAGSERAEERKSLEVKK